jgi:hypothetical protein
MLRRTHTHLYQSSDPPTVTQLRVAKRFPAPLCGILHAPQNPSANGKIPNYSDLFREMDPMVSPARVRKMALGRR